MYVFTGEVYILKPFRDICEKLVADLGSGPGVLSIGAALLGASHVIGFEIDTDALETAVATCEEMEVDTIDFVQCDVTQLNEQVPLVLYTVKKHWRRIGCFEILRRFQ